MTITLDKWAIYDSPFVDWQPHRGQLIVAENPSRHKVVSAGRRWGKALDIATPVLTINGWRTMETVKVGDHVYSWDGKPVEIVAISEIMYERPCYEITFNGAESIVCDAQHNWYAENKSHRKALGDHRRRLHSFNECVRTTEQMVKEGVNRGKDYNFTIPHAKALDFQPDWKLPLDPYILGVWLGDGTTTAAQLTLNEDDAPYIVGRVEDRGFDVTKQSGELAWGVLGLRAVLREMKLLGNKHIPKKYLFSEYSDRLALLQGLMDTDGWVEGTGAVRFSSMNRNLAHSVWHLVVSLGGRVQLSRKNAILNGKSYGMSYELHIVVDFPIFSCKRKLDRQFEKSRRGQSNRSIRKIESVTSRPVRCITVANDDGMFLCGKDLIPTHNSYLGAIDKLLPEVFFTRPIANTLLSEGKKRIFWIVGPNFSDSEKEFRVIWNMLKKLEIPMVKPSYNSPETGDMIITLWGGAMQIVAKSAQNPERLVGEGLSGVIMSEAAKLKEHIWPKYIRPTLADYGGWSFWSSTPEGKNHFYEMWRKAQDPSNTDWASWRMPAWVNNYVYKTPTIEADVMKCLDLQRQTNRSVFEIVKDYGLTIDSEILDSINELSPEAFLQEIASDFTEFVGRVFKEFDEEKHVTDLTYNPGWQTFAAVDYGYSNPNVWLLIQMSKWGDINVLDEIYEEGLDPEDFADEIRWRGLNPPSLQYFFPDPADPGASKILEKKLCIRAMGGTGGELNNRINWIRKALREPRVVIQEPYHEPDLEPHSLRPRLLFDRKCVKTIKDMLDYRYPEKKVDSETSNKRYDLPMKKFDHAPEALGRFFAGFFGQFGKPHTGARVHEASFSRNYTQPDHSEPQQFWKPDKYRRPTHGETRRTDFPKINDAFDNYMQGAYD